MGVQQLLRGSSRVHCDQDCFFRECGGSGSGQRQDCGEKYQQPNAVQFHADAPQTRMNPPLHDNLFRICCISSWHLARGRMDRRSSEVGQSQRSCLIPSVISTVTERLRQRLASYWRDAVLVPKSHTCFKPCELALVILKLAIYENVFDTLRKLRRMLVSGFIHNCGWIEDGDVRKIPRLEQAPIAEPFTL